jgi:hypothetical protein
MSIDLRSLQKGKRAAPPRLVVYGPHGIGKTTFANDAKAVFIPTEDGLAQVDVTSGAFPLCKRFEDVINALGVLATEPHDLPAVAIDTADWLEKLIWEKVCRESGVASIELANGGYGKGYGAAVNLLHEVLDACDYLRNERRMAIIVLAHAKIKRFDDPTGEPYDRYMLDLHEKAASRLQEWADAVLFVNYRTYTTKDKRSDKHRGTGQGERILHTEARPAYQAKNRYNLPDTMSFNWDELKGNLNV